MIDLITRILPAETAGSLVLTGVAWFGLHFGVIGPEVGQRLGDLQHLPRCEADIEALQLGRIARRESDRDRIRALREAAFAEARARLESQKAKLDQARAARDLILKQTPIGDMLKAVDPEGALETLLGAAIPQIPDLQISDPAGADNMIPEIEALGLPEIPDPLPMPDPSARRSYCGCLIDPLVADHRREIAGWTASLTLWRPGLIADFPGHIAELAAAGACGGLPKE